MGDYGIIDLSQSEKWSEYIQELPEEQQDIYYTPEYYFLYEKLGHGKARCFIYREDKSLAIYPFLLNSVNKLGYALDLKYYDIQGAYGYNGVISNDYSKEFISHFYSSFGKYIHENNIIAEFTRFHPLLRNKLFSEMHLQVIFDRKTMYLELQNSYDKIFSNFQTTTRKQIKRATTRYKLYVKSFENDISILDDFISIYHHAMIRVQSVPGLFFNRDYFKSLIENTRSICFMAYHNQKPVACILAFYNGYYINGHLGGALTDYLHMSPFSLLFSEMIKFGKLIGCRYLNVGGGATGNPDDPLMKFKMNFSKTTSDFFIGKKIYNQVVYNEIIRQWSYKYPEKVEKYKNLLLKYRY